MDKKKIIYIVTAVVIVIFSYLVLLNGRYLSIMGTHAVFDKWTGKSFEPKFIENN